LALFARLVLGMGLECQNVVVYAFIALWFRGKEQGLACAGVAMMMRLGMVSTDFVTPLIQQSSSKLVFPFIVALCIALVALGSAGLIVAIDRINQAKVKHALKRTDTLESKYLQKHSHDLDIFRKDSGFQQNEEGIHI